jgi:hypothetical protein
MESRVRLALVRARLARIEAGRAAYCEALRLVVEVNRDVMRERMVEALDVPEVRFPAHGADLAAAGRAIPG